MCKDNPINSCTTKLGEHISSAFLMSTISSFKITENNRNVFSGKYCMKKFCESLRKHVMEITDFKTKEIKLLTNEQQKSYENAKIGYICKENLSINMLKMKIID